MDPLIEGYHRFRADFGRASGRAMRRWPIGDRAPRRSSSRARIRASTPDHIQRRAGRIVRDSQCRGARPGYSPDPGHHGTSAALEFGVRVLKVLRLVVMGHGQCGGVKAMAFGPPPQAQDFIAYLGRDRQAGGGRGRQPEGRLERIEAEAVRLSLANLMTFPWIAEAVAADRLVLQGFLFDVHTGVLASIQAGTGSSRWIKAGAPTAGGAVTEITAKAPRNLTTLDSTDGTNGVWRNEPQPRTAAARRHYGRRWEQALTQPDVYLLGRGLPEEERLKRQIADLAPIPTRNSKRSASGRARKSSISAAVRAACCISWRSASDGPVQFWGSTAARISSTRRAASLRTLG